jgi:hypothetical protein
VRSKPINGGIKPQAIAWEKARQNAMGGCAMMEIHPLAKGYRRMTPAEHARVVEDMKANGYDERFPVILYEGKIADGVNRHICADEAGVRPTFDIFEGTIDQLKRYIKRANKNRRHLSPEEIAEMVDERIEKVVEAREEGKSLRTIAEEVKVSESQVRSDLERAQLRRGCAVEPKDGKVMGQDDKERAATKPPILCSRCKRTGAVKDCQACAEARKAKPKATPSRRKPPPKPTASKGFDWGYFINGCGILAYCIDKVGDDTTATKLKTSLEDFKDAFKVWAEKTLGEKSPELTKFPAGLLRDERFQPAWAEWEEHRRELRKPLTELAAKKQLKQLGEWGPERAVAAIELSIRSGWQGIFEGGKNGKPTKDMYEGLKEFMAKGDKNGPR